MPEENIIHVIKLPITLTTESVEAAPVVGYSEKEVLVVLTALYDAVDAKAYIPSTPTKDNPALSDDYIFDVDDEMHILKDLTMEHFVAKVKDLSKGAARRKSMGFPPEFLYVFRYHCRLMRRDSAKADDPYETLVIYIKINYRTIPGKKVFVISFHKNRK